MWVGLTRTWNTRCCRPRSSTGCSEAIPPRDFFAALHRDEAKENLAEELAKTLTIDTEKVDPALPHALPALWNKRTDWEASRGQRQSGAESAKTMVRERRGDVR